MLCATAGVGCQYTPRHGTRRQAELITWAGVVNYALFDTPLEDTYGANVPRLRRIKAEIDPQDMMGLTGGCKFDMLHQASTRALECQRLGVSP